MFPTDSILMRQFVRVVGTAQVTVSEPSFGVPGRSGTQLVPPSVESRMFTVGEMLPPPTDHVTVNGTPAVSVLPPFGNVTANGAPETVITLSSHDAATAGGCRAR